MDKFIREKESFLQNLYESKSFIHKSIIQTEIYLLAFCENDMGAAFFHIIFEIELSIYPESEGRVGK